MTKAELPACAVLLAGGRGTRFWPRSRMRTPKQLLNIAGMRTMLRESVERLHPLFPAERIWVVTNKQQAEAVRREMPGTPDSQILAEPAGRNTAAAIGLAAVHLVREHGDALMAVLSADHHMAQAARFRRLTRAALQLARDAGTLVMMGIPPTRPDTGFGYVECGEKTADAGGFPAYKVLRFTEKPSLNVARRYMVSGRHYWNSGMFFWRVSSYLDALRDYLPATHAALESLAKYIGTPRYAKELVLIYPRLESISVDYAIMEPATDPKRSRHKRHVVVLPAKMGWSDLGSWAAVYELLARKQGQDVSAGPFSTIDTSGNFFWSPGKFVAAIGVHDLIVVETEDALLVCPRERSQDVGRIVKWLEENNLKKLL
jgi:mannose-1-phosphate guanylyltransferase